MDYNVELSQLPTQNLGFSYSQDLFANKQDGRGNLRDSHYIPSASADISVEYSGPQETSSFHPFNRINASNDTNRDKSVYGYGQQFEDSSLYNPETNSHADVSVLSYQPQSLYETSGVYLGNAAQYVEQPPHDNALRYTTSNEAYDTASYDWTNKRSVPDVENLSIEGTAERSLYTSESTSKQQGYLTDGGQIYQELPAESSHETIFPQKSVLKPTPDGVYHGSSGQHLKNESGSRTYQDSQSYLQVNPGKGYQTSNDDHPIGQNTGARNLRTNSNSESRLTSSIEKGYQESNGSKPIDHNSGDGRSVRTNFNSESRLTSSIEKGDGRSIRTNQQLTAISSGASNGIHLSKPPPPSAAAAPPSQDGSTKGLLRAVAELRILSNH